MNTRMSIRYAGWMARIILGCLLLMLGFSTTTLAQAKLISPAQHEWPAWFSAFSHQTASYLITMADDASAQRAVLPLHCIPLSNRQWICQIPKDHVPDLPGFRMEPIAPVWKLSASLANAADPFASASDIQLQLLLKDTQSIRTLLDGQEVKLLQETPALRHCTVRSTRKGLQLLLDMPEVIHIQHHARRAAVEKDVPGMNLSATAAMLAHTRFPAIRGQGIVMAIKEDRFDTSDIDLRGRHFLNAYTSRAQNTHATYMATMAAGAGNTQRLGKGVAWGATLTSTSFENLMPEPPDFYATNRISLQNHSYGVGVESEYGADGAAYDLTTWQDSVLLHVFSAGNAGLQTPPAGVYAGISKWANLTGSFKMSKNSLAIAALDSFNQTDPLSSRGPAYDGRIKPELATYGEDGTSGAAAFTTGTAALVQQALRDRTGQMPSAALVKAVLIGSADDRGAEGPDFVNGYGHLNAYQALQLVQNGRYATGKLQSGQLWQMPVMIEAGHQRLAVTLCWNDTAGHPAAIRALQNDLNLTLEAPDGSTIRPWVLNSFPHADSLAQPARRGTDQLNVVEMISLINPPPGQYTIRVAAGQLVTNAQSFAVVWHVQQQQYVEFTNPTALYGADASETLVIRWKTNLPTNITGKLWVQSIESGNSTVVEDNIPVTREYAKWKPESGNAYRAVLHFETGSLHVTSDTFTVNPIPAVRVGFLCQDSVLLYWAKVPNARIYHVYNLADTFFRLVKQTTDTVHLASVSGQRSTVWAVAPVIDGQEGERSLAINHNAQGVSCYIRSFLAGYAGNTAELQLTVGTLYGVREIIFEKSGTTGFAPLTSIQAGNELVFRYTDAALITGANRYRARIVLTNGAPIFTEVETIYFTGNNNFLAFPNPAPSNSTLQIISKYSDVAYADVYDITGRKLKTIILDDLIIQINISAWPSGTYFIRFHNGKEILQQQKLVVL